MNQINSAFMYAGKLPAGNVWDIGLNIGSKFTPNSFLCESGNDYVYNTGLPKVKDNNKFALVPVGQSNKQNLYNWSADNFKYVSKDFPSKFVSDFFDQKKTRLHRKDSLEKGLNSNDEEDKEEEKEAKIVEIDEFGEPIKDNKTSNPKNTEKHGKLKGIKKRRNLCVREDVMNKNILRAFKRELITIYEEFEGSNLISGFREKIKEFSDDLLFTSNFNSDDKKDFNCNKFYTFVAILINY